MLGLLVALFDKARVHSGNVPTACPLAILDPKIILTGKTCDHPLPKVAEWTHIKCADRDSSACAFFFEFFANL
jgi:hypothetical protein